MKERLRPLAYPNTHAFLICFALDGSDSLENVTKRWMPEILHFKDPTTPILLVGCKKDIRDEGVDFYQRHVNTEQGTEVAESIKARTYFECSVMAGEGIREIFHYASQVVRSFEPPQRRRERNGCVIL